MIGAIFRLYRVLAVSFTKTRYRVLLVPQKPCIFLSCSRHCAKMTSAPPAPTDVSHYASFLYTPTHPQSYTYIHIHTRIHGHTRAFRSFSRRQTFPLSSSSHDPLGATRFTLVSRLRKDPDTVQDSRGLPGLSLRATARLPVCHEIPAVAGLFGDPGSPARDW